MEEKKEDLAPKAQIPTTPNEESAEPKSPLWKSKWFLLGIYTVILAPILLFGVYKLGQNSQKNQGVVSTPTPTPVDETANWKTYNGSAFSIKYPADYQLNVDKIVATEGIVEPQENTIQLISPALPNTNGNLSIIIAYKPTKLYLEEAVKQGSTCPELSNKKLEVIQLGNYTFSQSGLVNCGPVQAAFFYILNGGNIYEAKVETTADYQKDALPAVMQILATMQFK